MPYGFINPFWQVAFKPIANAFEYHAWPKCTAIANNNKRYYKYFFNHFLCSYLYEYNFKTITYIRIANRESKSQIVINVNFLMYAAAVSTAAFLFYNNKPGIGASVIYYYI